VTHAGPDLSELLMQVERYYDAVPRSAADVVSCGPFTLFVARTAWTYYARPAVGRTDEITVADVTELRRFQVERGVPEQIEWVPAVTPSLASAAAAAGLLVHRYPLLVLEEPVPAVTPHGFVVRLLEADDPSLGDVLGAVHLGFGSVAAADEVADVRERVRSGLQVLAAAFDLEGTAVGGGAHQPVNGVTELVGIAVVPEVRRRGIGAALTSALVADAGRQGVGTVFLSAQDDAVARTYERVGFRRAGTVAAAEPPPSPPDP
jgi:ribosomal protein S18 acetylase RimI-like enzyme